jgi:YD repeat-containing protein
MIGEPAVQNALSPNNVGPLEDATHYGIAGGRGDGPFMEIWLRVEGETVQDAAYRTYGCRIAAVCGGALVEVLMGRTLAQASDIGARDAELVADDALGYRTTMQYDLCGNLTTLVDADGNASAFAYATPSNRLRTRAADPLGRVTSFGYDLRHEVARMIVAQAAA